MADAIWDRVQRATVPTFGTHEDPTGFRLGWEWLSGNGPKDRELNGCHRFTKILQEHENIQGARDEIIRGLQAGEYQADPTRELRWDYSLGGKDSMSKLVNGWAFRR